MIDPVLQDLEKHEAREETEGRKHDQAERDTLLDLSLIHIKDPDYLRDLYTEAIQIATTDHLINIASAIRHKDALLILENFTPLVEQALYQRNLEDLEAE